MSKDLDWLIMLRSHDSYNLVEDLLLSLEEAKIITIRSYNVSPHLEEQL